MAWTEVTINTTWQHYGVAKEIADAINRRYDVIYVDPDPDLYVAVDGVTVFDFVHTCQLKLEIMASIFVFFDNTDPISDYIGQASVPFALSQAAIMTAAGLVETGFWRRVPHNSNPPAYWQDYTDAAYVDNYGRIQDKDMAGPWLFKDLQLVLSQLRRLRLPYSGTNYTSYLTNQYGDPALLPTNLALNWLSNEADSTVAIVKDRYSAPPYNIVYKGYAHVLIKTDFQVLDEIVDQSTGKILSKMYVRTDPVGREGDVAAIADGLIMATPATTCVGEWLKQDTTTTAISVRGPIIGIPYTDVNLPANVLNVENLAEAMLPDAIIPNGSEYQAIISADRPLALFDLKDELN